MTRFVKLGCIEFYVSSSQWRTQCATCTKVFLCVQVCYDPGSDFSGRLLTGYDYGIPQASSYISHGQSSQSAKEYHMYDNDSFLGSVY